MINLSKAIAMAKDERDQAATNAGRRALNTAINMLQRAEKCKPVFRSQMRYVPTWMVQEVIEFDLEITMIGASVMLEG